MRALVVALVIGWLADPAFADDKAIAHYKQGRAYEKAQAYDKAIAEFEAAFAIDAKPSHLYNIGLDYELTHDLKKALEYFQRYIALDPKGSNSEDARRRVTVDTQTLLDEEAKRKADEARIAAEQKKLKDEQDAAANKAKADQDAAAKKTAVLAHQKQAAAYAQAGAWEKAGEEHRAAATVDGDPQHLLDAADAFEKQPDPAHAREALLAYLDKVPTGAASDKIRIRVAELTKAIEKADAERARVEQAERQRLAALQLGTISPPPPKRHITIGAELRGGLTSTASFVTEMPFMEVGASTASSFGIGAFADLPVLQAWHVLLGLRAQFFKAAFKDECGSIPMCPTEVSGRYIGPALVIEQPIIHQGKFDLYGVGGFFAGAPIGKGKVKFTNPTNDAERPTSLQLAPEFGIGFRYGMLSLHFVFQISITKFNNSDLGADRLDVGNPRGVYAVASWALPR